MRKRQQENLLRALVNPNENWMYEKLLATGHKWRRQVIWGYRIFDFWNRPLGIAVEVDGPEHNTQYDEIRDSYCLNQSGIMVLRVRNMNEEDAAAAIATIMRSETWNERRAWVGVKPVSQPCPNRRCPHGAKKHFPDGRCAGCIEKVQRGYIPHGCAA